MKLTGMDAIEFARATGVLLSSYDSDETDASDDLSADEAGEIAAGVEVDNFHDGLARYQADLVRQSVRYLVPDSLASGEEAEALLEIFDVEGFGGAEAAVRNPYDATILARELLDWLRDNREEEAAGDRLPF